MVARNGKGRRDIQTFPGFECARRGVICRDRLAPNPLLKSRRSLPYIMDPPAATGLLLRMDVLAEFPGQFRRTPKMVNEKLFFSGVLPPMGQIRLVHRCFLSFCVRYRCFFPQPNTGRWVFKLLTMAVLYVPIPQKSSYFFIRGYRIFAEAIVLGLCQRKFFQLLFCRLLGIIRQSVLVSRLWVEILADTVAVPAGRSSERPAPIFRQRSYKLPISSSFISYILSHFNEPFKKLF